MCRWRKSRLLNLSLGTEKYELCVKTCLANICTQNWYFFINFFIIYYEDWHLLPQFRKEEDSISSILHQSWNYLSGKVCIRQTLKELLLKKKRMFPDVIKVPVPTYAKQQATKQKHPLVLVSK